jgi:hypothetical protein
VTGRAGYAKVVAAFVGVVSLAIGLWAFFAPANFYDRVAAFPPYNRHFIHDLGSFQIGFGVLLLLATRWADALFVGLAGFGTGAAFHFASHVIDRHLGGRTAFDLFGLGLLAVASLAAAAIRLTTTRPASPPGRPPGPA